MIAHCTKSYANHYRSRRRLEARLEQVNDTLSRTLPVSQLSESGYRTRGPLHASTPLYKKHWVIADNI